MPDWQGDGHDFRERTASLRMTPVVRVLLFANIAVFILQNILRRRMGHDVLADTFGMHPPQAVLGGHVWQFVTYAFLHGGLRHILFNMLFLYWFGRDVETRLGSKRFVWFYFGAAVAGAAVFCPMYVKWGGVMFGASGAIMGVVVVYAIYWPNRTVLFLFLIPMKVRTFALLSIGIDLYAAYFDPYGGVASLAHLGGAAYGYLYLKLYPHWSVWRASKARWQEQWNHRREARDDELLDKVVDKVHEYGMHTLTDGEKKFLKRMSRTPRT